MMVGKHFRSVEKKFVLTILALTTFSILALGFVLYEATTVRFSDQISSNDLSGLVANSPEVEEYLQQEKDYQAHFVTIANLVKEDQQQLLTQVIIWVLIPVLLISGLIGYFIARYLLNPVKEVYVSQERFMQDAAHELRNPLAAISVALENSPQSSTDQKLVKTLKRQTKRLVNIVEDMLFLERRKSGDKVAENNVSLLLQDVLEDIQPTLSARSIKLKADIEPDILIKIDSLDFIKLSRNIIENAIKYSADGTKINVSLTKAGRMKLVVKDRGIGIPESDIAKIGERFYRAQNAGKISGTGLGIAIVNKVLNAYGGKIQIESKVNKGTTVTVTI